MATCPTNSGEASLLLTAWTAAAHVAEHFMHNMDVLDAVMKQKSIATTGTSFPACSLARRCCASYGCVLSRTMVSSPPRASHLLRSVKERPNGDVRRTCGLDGAEECGGWAEVRFGEVVQGRAMTMDLKWIGGVFSSAGVHNFGLMAAEQCCLVGACLQSLRRYSLP